MTGKEILQAEFDRAGKHGYMADQVDTLLQQIAAFVDEQENEKNDLTYKIQILADKIEEYKKDEENIREALLGAQKLGSSILNEAKSKAETITREAKASSDEMLSKARAKVDSLTKESLQKANHELAEIKHECENEQRRLEKIKKEVSTFRASLLKQYKQHLDLLNNLPSVEEAPAFTEPAASFEKPQEPIPVSVEEDKPSDPHVREEETPAEEDTGFAVANSETIHSDFAAIESDIAEEEKGHTKEFHSKSSESAEEKAAEEIDREENAASGPEEEKAAPSFGRKSARPNYIEKFGELKFGGFNDDK